MHSYLMIGQPKWRSYDFQLFRLQQPFYKNTLLFKLVDFIFDFINQINDIDSDHCAAWALSPSI